MIAELEDRLAPEYIDGKPTISAAEQLLVAAAALLARYRDAAVPREPTEAMKMAALEASRAHGPMARDGGRPLPECYELAAAEIVWRAMYDAAAQPAAPAAEPTYCGECGQLIPDDVDDVEAWSARMGRVLAATPSDNQTRAAPPAAPAPAATEDGSPIVDALTNALNDIAALPPERVIAVAECIIAAKSYRVATKISGDTNTECKVPGCVCRAGLDLDAALARLDSLGG